MSNSDPRDLKALHDKLYTDAAAQREREIASQRLKNAEAMRQEAEGRKVIETWVLPYLNDVAYEFGAQDFVVTPLHDPGSKALFGVSFRLKRGASYFVQFSGGTFRAGFTRPDGKDTVYSAAHSPFIGGATPPTKECLYALVEMAVMNKVHQSD
jgi:hypothetical protein